MHNTKIIHYLPLGDSYTICTGATESQSWPVILVKHLNESALNVKLINNPAQNGFSSQDLIDNELPILKSSRPDFVTLLIGVNDWVRGVSKNEYEKNLVYILDEVEKILPDRSKIILITIPDFGKTPQGKNYSRGRNISEGISEFNAVLIEEAKKRKLNVVDIFNQSQKMEQDASLIASDGLHPSAKEYANWERMILPVALKLFEAKGP